MTDVMLGEQPRLERLLRERNAEIERLRGEVDVYKALVNEDLRVEIMLLRLHVAELSRVLNEIANRRDFADKVIAALEPKP